MYQGSAEVEVGKPVMTVKPTHYLSLLHECTEETRAPLNIPPSIVNSGDIHYIPSISTSIPVRHRTFASQLTNVSSNFVLHGDKM